MDDLQIAASVLDDYGLNGARIEPVGSGLINRTWHIIRPDSQYILQKVNPMFPVEIHLDIEMVTAHLEKSGVTTPRLLTTQEGELFQRDSRGVWRVYTYLEGVTFNNVDQPGIVFEAGRLLGQFHRLIQELPSDFKNARAGVHDTQKHLLHLERAVQHQQGHARYRDILPLAREILEYAGSLPKLPETLPRKVHGDPKLNNFLFDTADYRGICMLDFDTLSNMPLPLELGDALRSWCNPAGENVPETGFSMGNFRAGLEGYAENSKGLSNREEWNAILAGIQTIYLELASRFCADALNEDYFSWDPSRFAGHSEHSEVRAKSQLNACKSLMGQLREAERILKDTFIASC